MDYRVSRGCCCNQLIMHVPVPDGRFYGGREVGGGIRGMSEDVRWVVARGDCVWEGRFVILGRKF